MKAHDKFIAKSLGCLVILSCGFFIASPIRAVADKPAPDFKFSEVTKLTLDPALPAKIFILNKTMLSFTIQLRVTDFNFVPLCGQSVGAVVTVEDLTDQPLTAVDLKPAESKGLVLKTSATELAKVEPGTYTAFLIVDEPDESKKAIFRELEIVVPAGEQAPTPLVDKWTLQAVRKNPFKKDPMPTISCSTACYLPLVAAPPGEKVVTKGLDSQLGVLVAENQDPVVVKGSLSTEDKDGVTRLPLVLENLKKPGTYIGTIDLLPNDEKAGTVEVTLKTTDWFWWPLLAMLLGIILAILAQHFEAIGRKILILNSRRHAISPGRINSQDGLKYSRLEMILNTWSQSLQSLNPKSRREKSGGQTVSPYDDNTNIIAGTKYCESVNGFIKKIMEDENIKGPNTKNKFVGYSGLLCTDLDLRSQNLIEPIKALRYTATPELDEQNKDYKAVLDELDFLESQLEFWKEFGARWAETYDVICGLQPKKEDKPLWPSILDDVPNFITTAKEYWNEKQIKLNYLAALDDQVKKAGLLAQEWPALLDRVKEDQKYIQYFFTKEIPQEYKEEIYAADRLLNQAWAELWLAKDADDLKERTTKADLDRVEALILGLYRYYITPKQEWGPALVFPPEGGKPMEIDRIGKFQDFLNKIKDRVLPVEDHTLLAKRYTRARLWREIAFFLLALGLAGLTGMTAWYFGKTFGSIQDYLTIGTWGLVTKAALEGLNAALEKLRGFSKA